MGDTARAVTPAPVGLLRIYHITYHKATGHTPPYPHIKQEHTQLKIHTHKPELVPIPVPIPIPVPVLVPIPIPIPIPLIVATPIPIPLTANCGYT